MNAEEILKVTNDLNEYLLSNHIENVRVANGQIMIDELSDESPIILYLNNNFESNIEKILNCI